MTLVTKVKSVVCAAALVLSGVVVASANAAGALGSDSCLWGNACLWSKQNYSGIRTVHSYDGWHAPTHSNSAVANGRLCYKTMFSSDEASGDAPYFVLFSKINVGMNYQDSYLADGAGTGPFSNQNWQDRVNYVEFFNGPNCR